MTIQNSLFNIATTHPGLYALIDTRMYPANAPQNVVLPYCVYQRVSNIPISLLSNDTDAVEARFQFDVYSNSYPDSVDVSEQLKLAYRRLNGFYSEVEILDSFLENENDLFTDKTDLYRISIDIMIQYRVITI